jgi:hypothetical protein
LPESAALVLTFGHPERIERGRPGVIKGLALFLGCSVDQLEETKICVALPVKEAVFLKNHIVTLYVIIPFPIRLEGQLEVNRAINIVNAE